MLGAILGMPRGAQKCTVAEWEAEWDVSEATAAVLPDPQALREVILYVLYGMYCHYY